MKYRISIIETKTYEICLSAKDEEIAGQKALDLFEKDKEKFELIDEDWNLEDVDEEG